MAAFLVTSGWRGGLANIAVANWGTSFIFGRGASAAQTKDGPQVSGDPEGRLESIAVHDDALALLIARAGNCSAGAGSTPSVFPLPNPLFTPLLQRLFFPRRV